MARHGENIRKRIDGRWEGRYLIYSNEKKRSLYRSVYGKSYEEAREKLIAQKECFNRPDKNEAVVQEPENLKDMWISLYYRSLFRRTAIPLLLSIRSTRKD